MKKLCCLLLAAVFCLTALVSCSGGTSIAIGALRLDNEPMNLFKFTDTQSYHEVITYQDTNGNETFTAEYYYEKAEDIYAAYNLVETIGDYTLYAYEGSIYTETELGVTAVLLLSGTYKDFAEGYMTPSFPLDGDILIQTEGDEIDDVVYATYRSGLTPQQTARASVFGVQEGDQIYSSYAVRDSIIESVTYEISRGDQMIPAAKREITVSDEKEDRFASVKALSSEKVGVDLIFVDSEVQGRHFDVPKGVYVGMETGAYAYTFYLDAELQNAYSYEASPITEPLTLYVVEK